MNFFTKAAIIGVSALTITACSGADDVKASQQADHKPAQMAEHNPEHNPKMHNAAKPGHEKTGHEMHGEKRIAVHISVAERQHVLEEMRGLLQSTQGVIEGLALDDMELVASSALAAGTHGRKTTENNIMHKKMPKEWMQLGMQAHKSMDVIAQMAKDGKPAKDIQLKLVDTMNACTACHAAFYLPEPK